MQSFLLFYTKKNFISFINIKRMQSVLVIAEHNEERLISSTRNVVTAARKIGGELTILVAGAKCFKVANSIAHIKDLKRVIVAENKAFYGFPAENLTPLILSLQKLYSFTHIVAGSTTFGKGILPRVAGKLDVPVITNVTDIKGVDVFVRTAYTGNVLMTVKVNDPIKVAIIRQSRFPPCNLQEPSRIQAKLAMIRRAMSLQKPISHKDSRIRTERYLRLKKAAENLARWQELKGMAAPINQAPSGDYDLGLTKIINRVYFKTSRPKLHEAKTIIFAGRGIGSKENFNILYDLADKLNAAVVASRSAVKAGFASKDMYIARNGRILSPELFIAIGLSGKVEDLAVMKESNTIIAINKDSKAPIFKIADYGLIGDLLQIVPKLNSKII